MQRPDRSHEESPRTIYVVGTTNDDLIIGLHNADPSKRAESARAIGLFHVYLALPHLLHVARCDADEAVRDVARQAVIALTPSQEAADRAIAGDAPIAKASVHSSQREHAAAVIALWRDYVANKSTPPYKPGQGDLVGPVIEYLRAWGALGAQDLDGVGLAAAAAVGAITRFLEIPNESAGAKSTSFRDAKARVAEYESLTEPNRDDRQERSPEEG